MNIEVLAKNIWSTRTSQITQVIHNIIDNAINFILEKRGIITIYVERRTRLEDRRGSYIVVHIRDNGEGIHPEMANRLFSRFATKSFYGTGLGLYISREIIERQDGMIWGKNNEGGSGAVFSFGLPAVQ